MDRFWVENYPHGVAHEINLDSSETLNDLFDNVCRTYPNNKALTSHGETITFAKTCDYVNKLAANLIGLGIKKGDRVAIIMPNLIQYPLSIFALFKVGAIIVNINPLYTDVEIDYLLENSEAKTVIILDLIANKLNTLYKKHALQNVIVTKIPDVYGFAKRTIMNFAIKYIKKLNVNHNYPIISFRDLIFSNTISSINLDKVMPEDLAFIQYTGATTGKAKGVMLSHYNIVTNLAQINAWLKPQIPDLDKQVAIDALPLYHIFSLTANLLTFFYLGSENVMIINPRDTDQVIKVLLKTPFTIFSALDTLYNHLLQSEAFKSHKYPHFKYSVAGGMQIRDAVAREWFRVTNVMPTNCYGLSESSPAVSLNPLNNSYDGSVGFPVPSMDIEIRDAKTYCIMAIGEIGVIWIKGPQVTKGYWNNIDETKLAIDENGWLNTHDLGYLSVDGKLYISGRLSEMAIVSGFNVYPAEIEDVLNSFSEIKESAVIGVPYEKTGERIVAFVVFKDGKSIEIDDMIAKCRLSLASYKVPHYIYIKNELPKTLVGKIDKKVLLENLDKGLS